MIKTIRRIRRAGLAAGLGAALLCTSCLGSNHLFEGLRDWNREASDSKWVNEIIFIPLIWIPVYSVALLGDYVIFNSVEFWTGDNPIGVPNSRPEGRSAGASADADMGDADMGDADMGDADMGDADMGDADAADE